MCPHFPSIGLNSRRAHCYNTRQCTAVVAAKALVVKLLLLGEGIVGKVHKRKRTNPDRRILATPALWNVVGRPLSLTHSIHTAAAAASGLCCLCQPPYRGIEIDKDNDE